MTSAFAERIWSRMSPAARTGSALLLLAVATLPVLSRQYLGRTAGEIPIFMNAVDALWQGRLYRDAVFEYPPYALIWFLAPHAWAHDVQSFRLAFGLEIWLFDAAIKAVFLWRGIRGRQGFPDLIPFFVYSLGSAALGHLLLMKYDAVPAALSLAAVLAVAGGRPLLGGATVALAAGTKAYPALFIPILAIAAWQWSDRHLRRFAAGVAIAAAPLLLLAAWMPWWKFAAFHGGRGLEVGSLAASAVWALHLTGVDASWALVGTSNEVGGPLASQLLAPARLFWVVSTLACLAMAVATILRIARSRGSGPAPATAVAALMLLTAAAFVATNTVFSPQFHLWLIPLAALVLEGRAATDGGLPRLAARAAWVVIVATMIVPTFYPSREYTLGLGALKTGVLVLRNVMLLYATVCLWRAAAEMHRTRSVRLLDRRSFSEGG
jgi:hypothetical protein